MQLVVRAEKTEPPTHIAVCEATAIAVAALLTSPEATCGDWSEPVREWESGPIAKVTRRARGVRWPQVQGLPGVTIEHDGAHVRAFVPGPVDQVPPEIAKLQVAGLDLRPQRPEPGAGAEEDPGPGPGPGAVERSPVPRTPYAAIALNPDVPMSTGKSAAQCGHAAHLLVRGSAARERVAWAAAGLSVRLVDDVPWRECVRRAAVSVRDAGHTEVAPGTMTAVAWMVR